MLDNFYIAVTIPRSKQIFITFLNNGNLALKLCHLLLLMKPLVIEISKIRELFIFS